MTERLSDKAVALAATTFDYAAAMFADEIMRLACEVQERRAVEAKLRELHVRYLAEYDGGYCRECERPWPCPTIRPLDGEQ